MKNSIIYFVFLVAFALVLSFFVKGQIVKGKLYYQTQLDTRVGSPFEASNSTSRYALTKSIVDNKSFSLNYNLAKFASPDVIIWKNKYLSIFTPGVSVLGIPFYLLGKAFGIQQLLTYLFISLISIVNVFLIAKISEKMGARLMWGILSGGIFLFATNSLVYSQTFTQHELSVFIILISFLLLFNKPSILKSMSMGFVLGLGLLIDIPNVIFLFPIVLYYLIKNIDYKNVTDKIKFSVRTSVLTIVIGLIPILMFYGIYNYKLTGSFIKIGQSGGKRFVTSTQQVKIPPVVQQTKTSWNPIILPFQPRLELNGFYTLIISNERAWWYYSPVVLFGFIGLYLIFIKNKHYGLVLTSIVGINIVMYCMFTDPWGGWAFGPRYLIPSAAILCLSISFFLERFSKNIWFILLFFSALFYSIWVNALGALTTANIPPKVEAINLLNPIPYTWKYNLSFISKNVCSSLIYNAFLQLRISASEYLNILTVIICLLFVSIFIVTIKFTENKNTN